MMTCDAESLDTFLRTVERTKDLRKQRVTLSSGIGPLIASAMVAAIGNGAAFAKGRDFAAWLGLVPKQMSTGDRTILGRISKRGNRYLRTLIMQGARVILLRPANWAKHSYGLWLTAAARRFTIMSWQPHSPISWRGSLGLCWHKVAATKRASSQRSHRINVFQPAEGTSDAGP